MKQQKDSFPVIPVAALLGGVALGGLAVAFMATESGRALRRRFAALGSRVLGGRRPTDTEEDDDTWGEAMFI